MPVTADAPTVESVLTGVSVYTDIERHGAASVISLRECSPARLSTSYQMDICD